MDLFSVFAVTETGEVDPTVDPVFLKPYMKKKERALFDERRKRKGNSDSTLDSYETAGGSQERLREVTEVPAVHSMPDVLKGKGPVKSTKVTDQPEEKTSSEFLFDTLLHYSFHAWVLLRN